MFVKQPTTPFKKQFFFLILMLIATKTPVFGQDSMDLPQLFNQKSNEINCVVIKALLKKYPRNINDFECVGCDIMGEKGFLNQIPYQRTKDIALKINRRKENLALNLSDKNFDTSLQTLIDFGIESSKDKTDTKENIAQKADDLKLELEKIYKNTIEQAIAINAKKLPTPTPNADPIAQNLNTTTPSTPDTIETANITDENVDLDLVPRSEFEQLKRLVGILGIGALLLLALSVWALAAAQKAKKTAADVRKNALQQKELANEMMMNTTGLDNKIKELKAEDQTINHRLDEIESVLFEMKAQLEQKS